MSQAATHRENIVKMLQQASRSRHLWDVFGDWVELMALSLANAVDLRRAEGREARYLTTVKRYEPDEVALFPLMFGELVEAMEAEPGDHLGMLFGELDLGNAARGQFFTPYHLCVLMADLTVDDSMREKIEHRGFITASEPAVGAGAMVIALAMAMQSKGLNYQQALHVTCVDVDPRAVHMAFVQLSLLHVPAVVILGNTLTMEEREHFYTPAHFLGFWDNKLRRGYAIGSQADQRADEHQAPPPEPAIAGPSLLPATRPADIQLQLFGAPA